MADGSEFRQEDSFCVVINITNKTRTLKNDSIIMKLCKVWFQMQLYYNDMQPS